MEHMDNVQEQLAALQQQVEQLKHETHALKAQTHTVTRQTRILLEAYDCFLARCQDGGITLEQEEAAWEVHSSAAFAAELIEAESYGPHAMHMIDEQILTHLGLPPPVAEVPVVDEDEA